MRSVAVLLLLVGACSGGGSTATVDAPLASVPDAAPDAPAGACTGACKTTALTATFGGTTRVLDRAYYGISKSATESTLYLEAYNGASPGCPTAASPTPHYTLILGKVGIALPGASPANLLDFVGDLLPSPAPAKATAVTLTTVAVDVCPTCVGMPAPADADGFVALDASLTFPTGTIAGHLYATHCDSMDEAL